MRLEMVNVATPLDSGAVSGEPPFRVNVTLPVGVTDAELTVTFTTPFAGYVTVGELVMLMLVDAGLTISEPVAGPLAP